MERKFFGPLHSTPLKAIGGATCQRNQILQQITKKDELVINRLLKHKFEHNALEIISKYETKNVDKENQLQILDKHHKTIFGMIEQKKIDLEEEQRWIQENKHSLKDYEEEIQNNFKRQESILKQMANQVGRSFNSN